MELNIPVNLKVNIRSETLRIFDGPTRKHTNQSLIKLNKHFTSHIDFMRTFLTSVLWLRNETNTHPNSNNVLLSESYE